jgi:tripartite-type tricarboxylate transporter receptor subunit TctC
VTTLSRRAALSGLAGALAVASRAGAQTAKPYPEKLVKVIVPAGPGGSGDTLARFIAQGLETATGQTFVIENRPGATGMIGTAQGKAAPADGYTLVAGSTSVMAANPSLYRQLTYDPDDFTTVAVDGTFGCMMLVHNEAPYRTVREFVAFAKARRADEPVFAGYGNASSRVPAALFQYHSGIQFQEVAYRDAVPSIQDLAAGRLHVVFPDQVVAGPYVRSGQVRAIGVTSRERSPQFKEIEAIAETYPGYEVIAYLSMMTRKETPEPIKQRLNALIGDILRDVALRERLLGLGLTPVDGDWPLDRCATFVREQREAWDRYIKLARIEPQ